MKINILFYITIFIFILALSFSGHFVDYDLWQRLLQGDYFLQNGTIMYDDPFSYVKVHNYIDYEWGSGVIFSFILKYFGYAGLTVLKALLMFFVFVFIFLTIKLKGLNNTKLSNILFFFIVINCFETVLISGLRCQLFTFLLFSIYLFILEKVRLENKNILLILLPFLMIFWCNVHGGCVAGIGLIGMYLIGEFLNKKPFKKYLYSLLGVILALFINPYGISYLSALFYSISIKRYVIAEWQSIFEIGTLLLLKSKIFMVFAAITGLLTLFNQYKKKNKTDYTKYIVLFVTGYLACSHIKHIPLFFISAMIFLYDDFFGFFNGIMSKIKNIIRINSDKFIKNFVYVKESIIYIFIITASILLIYANCNNLFTEKELRRFPVKIVEFMKINDLKGAILNKFDIGSYLAYKLYPNNLIYMDGRYEALYYPDTTDDNLAFYDNEKNAANVFKNEGFPNYIIVHKQDLIYPNLYKLELYKEIYGDKDYALFIRKDLQKEQYVKPVSDNEYYIKTYFDKL